MKPFHVGDIYGRSHGFRELLVLDVVRPVEYTHGLVWICIVLPLGDDHRIVYERMHVCTWHKL